MTKLLKKLTKKDLLLILISFTLIAIEVYFDLKIPDYMSDITILVQTEGSKLNDILRAGGKMIICAFAALITMVCAKYFTTYIGSNFTKNLRDSMYKKVGSMSTAEIKKFSTSSLITRTTNDINQVEMLLSMGLQLMIKAPLTALYAIKKIVNRSLEWSLLTGACLLALLLVIGIVILVVLPKFKRVQKLIDSVNDSTRENLTGIRVVRAFNAEKYQENKFSKVNNELTDIQLFNQKRFAILPTFMMFTMHFLTLGIYVMGAFLISNSLLVDKLTLFSNMVVFSSYALEIIMSFVMLAVIFMMFPRAQVSATRINEVLDEENSIKNGTFKNNDSNIIGEVEFKNVSFKYPDAEEYLLENISFTAKKGETVAFIGSTGCGKSSLINLIPRFYDVTEGEVLIDGVNVKDYDEHTLNKKLGYVSQKAALFSGTVKSNIVFGEGKFDKKRVDEALKISQASSFVDKMGGISSDISQNGTNVSGGQKQRLSIARAIYKNPEIYIFDDSFSALDYKTDAKLRSELRKYTKDATVLIVASRIGTIMNADKIIVLDNGKCVGIGKHKELLKKCKVYKEIAYSQLSESELESEK